jgi:hypothetical protein
MSDLRALAHHLAMHPSSKRDKIEDDIHAALLLARSEALEEAERLVQRRAEQYRVDGWNILADEHTRTADAIAAARRGT